MRRRFATAIGTGLIIAVIIGGVSWWYFDLGQAGYKPLFNGKDLSGWSGTKEQKEHWKTEDGVLAFDGKPGEQSRLSTEKTFGDFELDFEWMPSASTKYTNLRYRGNGEESGVVSGLMGASPWWGLRCQRLFSAHSNHCRRESGAKSREMEPGQPPLQGAEGQRAHQRQNRD